MSILMMKNPANSAGFLLIKPHTELVFVLVCFFGGLFLFSLCDPFDQSNDDQYNAGQDQKEACHADDHIHIEAAHAVSRLAGGLKIPVTAI